MEYVTAAGVVYTITLLDWTANSDAAVGANLQSAIRTIPGFATATATFVRATAIPRDGFGAALTPAVLKNISFPEVAGILLNQCSGGDVSTGVPEVVRSAINVDTRGVYGELVCNLQDVNLQSLVLHSGPSPIVATTRMTNVNLGNDRLDIGKIAVSTQNKVLDGRDAYDVSYAHNKHKPTSQVSVELVWEDPPFLSSSNAPRLGLVMQTKRRRLTPSNTQSSGMRTSRSTKTRVK